MTAEDVLYIARKKLADTNPGQVRWTNFFLLKYLSESLFATYKLRPDLFLSADVLTPPTEVDALDDTIGLDDEYLHMLADHLCYLALMEDNSDSGNTEQANTYKTMYMERIGI